MTALMDVSREQVATLDELVDLAVDMQRSIAAMQAGLDGVLALASRWALSAAGDVDEADITLRTVAAELGAALRVSDRTVQRRMGDAELKVERFPAVWQAQGTGRISAAHARVIIDAGVHLDDAASRDAYAARVLEFAEEESPNRVRAIAARIAEQYQPRPLEERHADARKKRSVWVKGADDGMAELGVFGPAALVHGAFERLTRMATTGTEPSSAPGAAPDPDGRTGAHKRADLALDLLLTGAPAGHDTAEGMLGAIAPHVSVTVPVTTLLGAEGIATPPAALDGRAPIDSDTARRLAGAASGWDRILTHPITGAILAADRYRPTASMRRQLQARDQRCRFLSCGMPSRENDLDHTVDAALGGATEENNLGGLCRRHHVLKHHSPWHVEQVGGGLLEWTSPTGRTYIDKPPPQNTVRFAEDGEESTSLPGAAPWAHVPAQLLAPF
ncbi:HNH endonuclease [Microbacterium esteraromaticum]|uniref:HNH endonuclease n=1 Tax=Microbacterium esteraromaticum TaxID=57043 RepID=UPI0019D3F6BF|nr:HNH endonuclease signature motif containing protein [Microbacterium esteraromaticum]MBN7794312.1 DUF222 domain-containing protein [Microbacterium esteraromaticum]